MSKNTTKTERNSKLAKYSAVAGAVIATGAVNAQVQYTDVNPDVVIDKNTAPYQLDFNADATVDLTFAVTSAQGSGTYMYGYVPISYTYQISYAGVSAGAGAQVMGLVSGSSSTFAAGALNSGDLISNAGLFGSGGVLAVEGLITAAALGFTYPIEQGEFLGATDKFLGANFTVGPNTHYGWVRLTVAADASTITIKDYAYNTQASTGINAGQMVNLQNIPLDNKVSIKTQLDQAIVNVTPDLFGGEIAVIDMAGKEVKVVTINDVNTTVTYEGIEAGIYMLTARFEGGLISKKVYVR
jgi:hypothetical protein